MNILLICCNSLYCQQRTLQKKTTGFKFCPGMLSAVKSVVLAVLAVLIAILWNTELFLPTVRHLALLTVREPVVHSTAHLPWAQYIRTNLSLILEEYHSTFTQRQIKPYTYKLYYPPELHRVCPTENWFMADLRVFGHDLELGSLHFPKTLHILHRLGIKDAAISLLEPGAEILEHRSRYFGIYRYHLTLLGATDEDKACKLVVYEERTGLWDAPEVGERILEKPAENIARHSIPWIPGHDILFDPTATHASTCEHSRDMSRVVFLFNVPRHFVDDYDEQNGLVDNIRRVWSRWINTLYTWLVMRHVDVEPMLDHLNSIQTSMVFA